MAGFAAAASSTRRASALQSFFCKISYVTLAYVNRAARYRTLGVRCVGRITGYLSAMRPRQTEK